MPVILCCPKCQKPLSIPAKRISHSVACPACGATFVANPAAPSAGSFSAPPISNAPVPTPTPSAPPPAFMAKNVVPPSPPLVAGPRPTSSKGFWATVKEGAAKAADAASRTHSVVYVSGPFDLKAKSDGILMLDDSELVFKSLFLHRELFRVQYASIIGASVDTAERMTLARAVALEIFAFGFKKKDKFLKLDFTDSGNLAVTVVFAKASFNIEMDTLQGKILAKRRDSLEQAERYPSPVASATPPAQAACSIDGTRLLEELASLRDRGILTDDEFQTKKADLLSRL